jgi:SAM-dependent methyltransferase
LNSIHGTTILTRGELAPKGLCLYVGLGTGVNIPLLSRIYEKVVVVEPNRMLIERFLNCQPTQIENISFFEGRFQEFSETCNFDSVFLLGVLEHFPNALCTLKNQLHQSKRGTNLFLTLNNPYSLHRQLGVAMNLIDDCFSLTYKEGPSGHGHYALLMEEEVTRFLELNHYEISHASGIYLKPLPTAIMENLPKEIRLGFSRVFPSIKRENFAYTFIHAKAQEDPI